MDIFNEIIKEQDLKLKLIGRLIDHFYIKEEYEGFHWSGRKMIIDLLLKPRDLNNWANKNLYFGIEIKGTSINDTKDVMKYVRQCIDYSHTKWNRIGYMPVFLCPPIERVNLPITDESNRFMQHFLNQFNIGEVNYKKYLGLCLIMAGTHVIWSEVNGVQEGNRNKLITKFGSQ